MRHKFLGGLMCWAGLWLVACVANAPATPSPFPARMPTLIQPSPSPTPVAPQALPSPSVPSTPSPSPTPVAPQAAPSPSAPPRIVPPTPAVQPAVGVFATLERAGGITGRTTTFVINFDGTVQIGKEVLRLADGSAAVAQLAAQLEATGIYRVPSGAYLPQSACYDCYYFELTLVPRGQAYHYEAEENSDTAPQALWATIKLILQYVEQAR